MVDRSCSGTRAHIRARSDAVDDLRLRLEDQTQDVGSWRKNRGESSVVDAKLPLVGSRRERKSVDDIELALCDAVVTEADLRTERRRHPGHEERAGATIIPLSRPVL